MFWNVIIKRRLAEWGISEEDKERIFSGHPDCFEISTFQILCWNLEFCILLIDPLPHVCLGGESFPCHFAGDKDTEVKVIPRVSGRAHTPTCISWAWTCVLSPHNSTLSLLVGEAAAIPHPPAGFPGVARHLHGQSLFCAGMAAVTWETHWALCAVMEPAAEGTANSFQSKEILKKKTASEIYRAFSPSESLAINNTWKDTGSCQGGLQRGWGNNVGTLHLAPVRPALSRS